MKIRKFETIYEKARKELKKGNVVGFEGHVIDDIENVEFFNYLMLMILIEVKANNKENIISNLRYEYFDFELSHYRTTYKQFYNEIFNRLTEQP